MITQNITLNYQKTLNFMNWTKRMAKVLGVWTTGFGGGLGSIFTISAYKSWELDFMTLFIIPSISGLIVCLPQLGKVLSEYSESK